MAQQGLATIGLDVAVNSVSMNYVTDIGDIGGTPSELDATCMKDTMKKSVPGVQDTKAFEVSFLYDDSDTASDYRVLKALQEAGSIVPIAVTFPDGAVFASTGYVSVMINGAKVDELISAKLTINLQSEWVVTNPATT
ncbi:MAG: phage tail protein [Oscillospiraceae bacterium]|nr:phage tail protein [Oscillospiraceae bacterium]